jgi:Na+-transporting NADH:ubiquinone oxidoreductase subunit E
MQTVPAINPLIIFMASILTSNMILSNFLGMCSYISISTEYKTASGLGKAVTLVVVLTTVINYAVYWGLVVPLRIEYLQYIVFIIVIAATVQIVEMAMDRFLPDLHIKLGIFLPLITVNCAILGIILFMVIRSYSFVQALFFASIRAAIRKSCKSPIESGYASLVVKVPAVRVAWLQNWRIVKAVTLPGGDGSPAARGAA